jgi:hypothetical protein
LARTAEDAFMEWSLFMQLMDEALADVGKRGKEFATNCSTVLPKVADWSPEFNIVLQQCDAWEFRDAHPEPSCSISSKKLLINYLQIKQIWEKVQYNYVADFCPPLHLRVQTAKHALPRFERRDGIMDLSLMGTVSQAENSIHVPKEAQLHALFHAEGCSYCGALGKPW